MHNARYLAFTAALGVAAAAHAQLRQDQVLVVYDSRVPDSRAVAEYYAGSAKVAGGAGGLAGARRGVRVLDLASTGAVVTTPGDIAYADFITRLRDPIRAHLTAAGLTQSIRCMVTTKGLPHRVFDTDAGAAGDNPNLLVDEYLANDATMTSVDTELALLWQNLTAGEAGGPADSKADGTIQNPYWKSAASIQTFPQTNIVAAKTFQASGGGPTWVPSGSGVPRLTPGDIYLVSRLDAPTVADVRAVIDRAGFIYYNTIADVALLDESGSNGVADPAANGEFDNSNTAFPPLWAGDDYELTRNDLAADLRFAAGFTRYNAAAGSTEFFAGPRIPWQAPGPVIVTANVVLLATYGSNHAGVPADINGVGAGTFYASSYNYASGAVFNTIESYNGRAFGGLGQNQFAPQQQASAFLAAGGTFALGNVWEPLADTVPDNRYLAANFIRGNLSWGEAATTATPGLSWMQLTLGDPLARAFRSSEDLNADGRVTIDDLYMWEAAPSDVNNNGTTDVADRAILLAALRSWERADLLDQRR